MNGPYTHNRVTEKTPEVWRPAGQKHIDYLIPRRDCPSTWRAKEVSCGLCLRSEGMMVFAITLGGKGEPNERQQT